MHPFEIELVSRSAGVLSIDTVFAFLGGTEEEKMRAMQAIRTQGFTPSGLVERGIIESLLACFHVSPTLDKHAIGTFILLAQKNTHFKVQFGERGGIEMLLKLFDTHSSGLVFSALCTFSIAPQNRYLMLDSIPKLVKILNSEDTTSFASCIASVFDDLSSREDVAIEIASLMPSLNPFERLAALGDPDASEFATSALKKVGKWFQPSPSEEADLAKELSVKLTQDRRAGIEDLYDFINNLSDDEIMSTEMTTFRDCMVSNDTIPVILDEIKQGGQTEVALSALFFLCNFNWYAKRVVRERGGVEVVLATFENYTGATLNALISICHSDMPNRRCVVDAGFLQKALPVIRGTQISPNMLFLVKELAKNPENVLEMGSFILPLLRLNEACETRFDTVPQIIELLCVSANDSYLASAKKTLKNEAEAKRAERGAVERAAAERYAEKARVRHAANVAEVEAARRAIAEESRAKLDEKRREAAARAKQEAAERAEKEKVEAATRREAAAERKRKDAKRKEEEQAREQAREAAEAAAAKEKAAAAKAAKKSEKEKKKKAKAAPSAFAKEAKRREEAVAEAREAEAKAAALAAEAEKAAAERAERAAARRARAAEREEKAKKAERAATEREAEREAAEREAAEKARAERAAAERAAADDTGDAGDAGDSADAGEAADATGDEEAPLSFVCPISHTIFHDPVITEDGQSYERICIEQWLEKNQTSPLTGAPLASKHLVPNVALRCAIREWGESGGK